MLIYSCKWTALIATGEDMAKIPPIMAAGATGGVVDRPSVRVASGTTGLLVHDGRVARSRRLLQVMALCSVLLLASWVRTEGDTDEGRDRP